ncbi:MAG: YCII--like protein [Gemmatimonadetes bacterium]|nr:YCII--like protein [Gemmatimonadota bacterium]
MKFMTMVSSDETLGPPPPALFGAIMKLGEEAMKSGVLVEQGGLHKTPAGARVRIRQGKISIVDGPFAESKEVVGGYAVYEVSSKEEVLKWTKRFMEIHVEHWPGWDGVAEVRQIFSASDIKP